MRLIDADALKERAIRVSTVKEHCYFKAVGTREIDKAPTVDAVEVVHGRWEGGAFNTRGDYVECCSVCKSWSMEYGNNYCPNCGAKMDGDGNGYPNHQKQYYFATVSSKDFNFVKTCSERFILTNFDELAFVVWLLDDGNVYKKTIKIATGSKGEAFSQKMVDGINERYGTSGVLYRHPDYPIKNYIRFGRADYQTIRDIVLKYVPCDLDIVISKFGGSESED